MDGQFDSIVHVISKHAREKSARDAIIFLARGETETERVSYGTLDAMAERHAGGFAAAGLSRQAVVIAMPPGAAFVAVFLGALRAGAIAVPVSLPDTDKNKARFAAVLSDARPAAIVTSDEHAARIGAAGTKVLTPDDLHGPTTALPALDPSQPAFVQYTSGSTQAPKGIAITHGNLASNQRMIQAAFGTEAGIVGVNWLPHFHDMGLIGTILHPLFLGGTAVLMPPRAFIQKPIRWLRAIEKYRSDTAGGPCFGFELCTRMIAADEARTLDLSSWQVAFSGAEPVRASVLNAFAERFAPAKFSAKAFLPCYGLAEATLIVSAAKRGSGVRQRTLQAWSSGAPRDHVSCGAPAGGGSVALRGEREDAGEICVAGPHLAPGHWDGARRGIAPFPDLFAKDGQTWLPTGDIGALVDGELYVVDRLKDFLILYGAKIHAADVETTALEESPDIRAACAFATDDGARERLVVVCEIERRRLGGAAALDARLARRIAEAHGVVPQVHLAPYGTLPRTSSGKIRRTAARTKFLSGELGLHKVETNAAHPSSDAE
ncbi:MAG TPA: fatty acyl-AMP ligase [Rhizomicrobium sp.]|nr:fatty acyl-AMP ligase [Rhizomicrobium sp.]